MLFLELIVISTVYCIADFARFLKSLGSEAVHFFFFHPHPGTCVNTKYEILDKRDWEGHPEFWSFDNQVVESGINEECIKKIHAEINGRIPLLANYISPH